MSTSKGSAASEPAPGRLEDLAVFGGPRAFDEPLYVTRPNVGDRRRLEQRLRSILDTRWMTNDGRFVREFEGRVAEHLGVEHCVAVASGTVGLQILARALELSGEVIVPSFTFVATAHALWWLGIEPVFCDVDSETWTLDAACAERLLGPRTSAIVGVHLWGQPCDVEGLSAVAGRRGVPLLFDAAHAFACSHGGRSMGTFGDAEVLSFHATKVLNTFEGGAVVTNDGRIAERCRLLRNYGFVADEEVIALGTNGKMSEVGGAMGLTSLEDLPEFVASNRLKHDLYRERLSSLPGITLREPHPGDDSNFHYAIVEVAEEEIGLSRDELLTVLTAENVLARRYFYPGAHRMEPYRSRFPDAGARLPETERALGRVLALPAGAALDSGDVGRLCDLIGVATSDGAAVRERLQRAGFPSR
jgi:dTDP-4-amino-4,6-dideoxygalactose transaminase